jgi:hypothetical protein
MWNLVLYLTKRIQTESVSIRRLLRRISILQEEVKASLYKGGQHNFHHPPKITSRWNKENGVGGTYRVAWYRSVFLNRWAAARYRALSSIIPGRERFSPGICNFSFLRIFHEWIFYSENIMRKIIFVNVSKSYNTTICYRISLVQWLITNLNVILYLSTCHTVYVSVLILFMIMP